MPGFGTWPPGTASGVGSLPGTDPREAARLVLGELTDLPHLPELPARGPGADLLGRGATLLPELYVDLNYNSQGGLIILRRPHATDPTKAADRVRRALEEGVVIAEDGSELHIEFSSICVHSDAPGSNEVARFVREVLTDHA